MSYTGRQVAAQPAPTCLVVRCSPCAYRSCVDQSRGPRDGEGGWHSGSSPASFSGSLGAQQNWGHLLQVGLRAFGPGNSGSPLPGTAAKQCAWRVPCHNSCVCGEVTGPPRREPVRCPTPGPCSSWLCASSPSSTLTCPVPCLEGPLSSQRGCLPHSGLGDSQLSPVFGIEGLEGQRGPQGTSSRTRKDSGHQALHTRSAGLKRFIEPIHPLLPSWSLWTWARLRLTKTPIPRTRATATSERTTQRRSLGSESLGEPAERRICGGSGRGPSTPGRAGAAGPHLSLLSPRMSYTSSCHGRRFPVNTPEGPSHRPWHLRAPASSPSCMSPQSPLAPESSRCSVAGQCHCGDSRIGAVLPRKEWHLGLMSGPRCIQEC